METDLELISDELFDMRQTSIKLVDTRKCADGEHRLYEVCATIYMGGEIFQAHVGVLVTDWALGAGTTASRTACDVDHANPLTQERTA